MEGVILAGGSGTRLRSLTFTEPMVPLVDKPVFEHMVDYLGSYGLNDIVVTTTYLHQLRAVVPDEEAFYFNMCRDGRITHTGLVANSIEERFVEILKIVDQTPIEYHLRDGHNDFARRIREFLDDGCLINELVAVIESRIEELKMGRVPLICQQG